MLKGNTLLNFVFTLIFSFFLLTACEVSEESTPKQTSPGTYTGPGTDTDPSTDTDTCPDTEEGPYPDASFVTDTGPGIVPSVPQSVSALAGDEQVTMSWNEVSGASQYNVYWSTNSGVTTDAGTGTKYIKTPSYIHYNRINGITYYFVVTAENSTGESAASGEVSATPVASKTPPDVPTCVSAKADAEWIKTGWNADSGASSYNIYWATSPGVTVDTGNRIGGISDTSYTHLDISKGITHYYIVTAENSGGESAASQEISATLSPNRHIYINCVPQPYLVRSSPIISDGAVYYAGKDGIFYAVDAESGKEKWRFNTELLSERLDIENTLEERPDIESTPYIYNGLIYLGDNWGKIYALDIQTGEKMWSFQTEAMHKISYVAVVDGVIYYENIEGLYTMDLETVEEIWNLAKHSLSFPLFSNGLIYTVSGEDDVLYALYGNSGEEKWRLEGVEGLMAVADGVVYLGGHNPQALDSNTGEQKWRFDAGESLWLPPVVADGVVYLGGNNLLALDSDSGEKKWSFGVEDYVTSPTVVADGLAFFGASSDWRGKFYAVDINTGQEKWKFTKVCLQVGFLPAVADNRVYFSSGNLYARDTNTGEEKWVFYPEGSVRSSPVVLNGVVYFTTYHYLYAVDAYTGEMKWKSRF